VRVGDNRARAAQADDKISKKAVRSAARCGEKKKDAAAGN